MCINLDEFARVINVVVAFRCYYTQPYSMSGGLLQV